MSNKTKAESIAKRIASILENKLNLKMAVINKFSYIDNNAPVSFSEDVKNGPNLPKEVFYVVAQEYYYQNIFKTDNRLSFLKASAYFIIDEDCKIIKNASIVNLEFTELDKLLYFDK